MIGDDLRREAADAAGCAADYFMSHRESGNWEWPPDLTPSTSNGYALAVQAMTSVRNDYIRPGRNPDEERAFRWLEVQSMLLDGWTP